MAVEVDNAGPATWLRAAIMVIGGVLGLFWSEGALATLAIIGGAIMVIDGALGLWRVAFGERSAQFWPTVVRSGLAVIAGILIVAHPATVAWFGLSALVNIVAVLMLIVAAVELYLVFLERRSIPKGRFWNRALGGLLYLAFGLLLFFLPAGGAVTIVRIGSILMLAYGLFLAYSAWQARQGG